MNPITCLAPPDAAARPLYAVRPGGLEAFLAGLAPEVAAFVRGCGFTGAGGEAPLLLPGDGLAGAVLGLGEDRSHLAFGDLARVLPPGDWRLVPGDYDPAAAVLGFCLGGYAFARYRVAKRLPARLVLPDGCADEAELAEIIWFVRDLINTPANDLGPAELAAAAREVADDCGAGFELIEGAALTAGYPCLAAVGAGSDRPPCVAILRWQGSGAGARAKLISLCGKGVVFDTGGLDLKPSSGMLRMKKDMGGAAILLGVAHALMRRDAPIRLELRLGCVENAVSGRAMRPGDVLATRAGLTVEIGNTDAEGRLVLADLLADATAQNPDVLIDAATLTGAARVATGPDLPALFCNDEALAETILDCGRAVHDPLWRLPLWDGYDAWLSSGVADLNNVSSKPFAGAIVAALFLRRFVAAGVKWAHIDVYAWNDANRPGRPEGGEAQALRALTQAILHLSRV